MNDLTLVALLLATADPCPECEAADGECLACRGARRTLTPLLQAAAAAPEEARP